MTISIDPFFFSPTAWLDTLKFPNFSWPSTCMKTKSIQSSFLSLFLKLAEWHFHFFSGKLIPSYFFLRTHFSSFSYSNSNKYGQMTENIYFIFWRSKRAVSSGSKGLRWYNNRSTSSFHNHFLATKAKKTCVWVTHILFFIIFPHLLLTFLVIYATSISYFLVWNFVVVFQLFQNKKVLNTIMLAASSSPVSLQNHKSFLMSPSTCSCCSKLY